MNILVLCNHGNVRSVGLKYLIQRLYGDKHDVLAAGVEENSKETLSMLVEWADKLIPLTDETLLFLDTLKYIKKSHPLIIGKDVWHNPFHQELQHKLLKHIKELDL